MTKKPQKVEKRPLRATKGPGGPKNHEKASKKWKKGPCGQQKAPAGNNNFKNSEITRKKQKKKQIY